MSDETPCRRLSELADQGDAEVVREELGKLSLRRSFEELQHDIVTCDFGKRNSLSALHGAAQNGHAEVLAVLLEANADANATDDTGNTPLHFAAELGHARAVSLLLQCGANKDAKNNFGRSPAEKLVLNSWDTSQCKAGKTRIQRLFRGSSWEELPPEEEEDVSQEKEPVQEPPSKPARTVLAPFAGLHSSLSAEDMDFLEDLPHLTPGLEKPPSSVSSRTVWGAPYAASEISTTATLIEPEVEHCGPPTFMELVWAGDVEVVRSHLSAVERQGGRRAVISEVSSMDDSSVTGRSVVSPLHVAANAGHEEVMQVLLATRADPNLADDAGNTLLHTSAGMGHEGLVRMLLEARADPSWRNNFGRSPRAHGQPQSWDEPEMHERKARLVEVLEACPPVSHI